MHTAHVKMSGCMMGRAIKKAHANLFKGKVPKGSKNATGAGKGATGPRRQRNRNCTGCQLAHPAVTAAGGFEHAPESAPRAATTLATTCIIKTVGMTGAKPAHNPRGA